MALAQDEIYTTDDIYALPDGERADIADAEIKNIDWLAVLFRRPFSV